MNAYDAMTSRCTTHFYKPDEQVAEETLTRALEAAIRAPNHKLTNPWRFTRIGSKTRQLITDLGVQLKCPEGSPQARQDKVRAKLSGAPVLWVVSQVLSEDEFRRKEDYASVACAIQNLSVSLWSEGVGSKWSSGGLTRHEDVYAWTGINPDEEQIVGFVWAGYPLHTALSPRRELKEVCREVL